MRQLDLEEKFLDDIENDIDSYVGQLAFTRGEVLYEEADQLPVQLTLFEEMAEYLATKTSAADPTKPRC
jgi:hypothetical protein